MSYYILIFWPKACPNLKTVCLSRPHPTLLSAKDKATRDFPHTEYGAEIHRIVDNQVVEVHNRTKLGDWVQQ